MDNILNNMHKQHLIIYYNILTYIGLKFYLQINVSSFKKKTTLHYIIRN